jgi:hypothetical protein
MIASRAVDVGLGCVIMAIVVVVVMIASRAVDVGLGCVIMAIVVVVVMIASRAVDVGLLSGVGFKQVEEFVFHLHNILGQDTDKIFDPVDHPGKEPHHKVRLFAFR